jgi:hypothetical protein
LHLIRRFRSVLPIVGEVPSDTMKNIIVEVDLPEKSPKSDKLIDVIYCDVGIHIYPFNKAKPH